MSAATLSLYALPPLGAYWPGQGGTFAGLRKGADGATVALIRADTQADGELTWRKAMDWAKALQVDGHADFTLPDREDGRLLWANDREAFAPDWYWLSVESSRSYAWCQTFGLGSQFSYRKDDELRARAVRRLILQSFDPSEAVA
jgi:hypothetical protein